MNDPRDEDRIVFFIESIEDGAAHGKPDENQQKQRKGKPPDHHRRMVERKQQRAEDVCNHAIGSPLEICEDESPKEKFFQQGIDKRNINSDEKEVFSRHSHR